MRALRLGVAAALCLLASPALCAEPGEGEKKAAAQALFDEGMQLTKAGDFARACPKLAESLRLDASLGTRFYLAECLEHVGKLASAWTYYVEVADAATTAGQKDRARYANDRAEALKPRLPRLAIKVPDAVRAIPGLEVKRDGVVVGEAQWGIAIPVDLGVHTLVAAAPKRTPWTVDVDVKQEGQLVEIDVRAPEEPRPPPPPPPPPPVEPPPPPPSPAPSGGGQRVAGFVVGGVGVVGVVVGSIFGANALSKKSASNDGHCDARDRCDTIGLGLRHDGLTAANASTAGFVLGGAALVTGVVLVAIAPRAQPPAAAPSAALGPAGAKLSWRW